MSLLMSLKALLLTCSERVIVPGVIIATALLSSLRSSSFNMFDVFWSLLSQGAQWSAAICHTGH